MSRKDCLVWCPVGGRPLAPDFGRPENRCFDLALCEYAPRDVSGGYVHADYNFHYKGSHKWPSVAFAFSTHRPLWGYSYYLFLDDDIGCRWNGINDLFTVMRAHRADLFQAALTRDSRTAWSFLKQMQRHPVTPVRPVDFVEVMMPGFSRQALWECFGTFGCSESGWGLDKLWPKCVRMARSGVPANVLVADNIAFSHLSEVTSGSWVLSNGNTPMQDMPMVEWRYLDTLSAQDRMDWEANR